MSGPMGGGRLEQRAMARPEQQLSPQRLFEAAEATLVAAAQLEHAREKQRVHVPALMGTSRQPRCLDEFARWEIEEASAFLVRLGLLEPDAAV